MDLSSLAGLLMGFHALAAIKVPEMALDEKEAKQLQERLEAVARWYPISATQKAIDHMALVGAVGWIYAPRLFAINRRLKQERGNAPPVPPRHNRPAPVQAGVGTNGAAPPSQSNTVSGYGTSIVLPSQFGNSVIGDDIIH